VPVNFFEEGITFSLSDEQRIRDWIDNIVDHETTFQQIEFSLGDISIVFCSDGYLLEINKTYLKHNWFTDIITFDYTIDRIISGDLLISIDTVKDNANQFNVSFENELHRVIAHGVLHLLGYNDKTDEEKQMMREKEDNHLLYLS